MIEKVSIAKAKSHFSEVISKVAFSSNRIIITKRNKPIAAIVNLTDLKKIDQDTEKQGLRECIGKWEDFEEIVSDIETVYKIRNKDKLRNVSF
jgi:prevent-host-death family protein